ncbi:hypothetical protein FHR83_006273 [Actinoplanes campanulatus]|uniref:Uncharacterized protein n=1 Tax=Actinoplanes campanulatus TaxID=113559 RepID=A0A7W5FHG2_9ACTN|nr:hypothetical protein [Actinoplanes campanulatus]MBB3098574.1 hypothetical protein [Actinoplanes campanulatus]
MAHLLTERRRQELDLLLVAPSRDLVGGWRLPPPPHQRRLAVDPPSLPDLTGRAVDVGHPYSSSTVRSSRNHTPT